MTEPTADAMRRLVEALAGEGLDPHALAIAHDGEIVAETAWTPWALDRPALSYSASKTFTSLAIGYLEDEGRLSLDDSVGDLLGLPNPHGLTVRHLLTMNTGHSPEQIDRLRFDVRALLTVAPASDPGSSFAYNSDATFALSCIVTKLTGDRLTDYLRPRLLDPLGIGRRWMKPARGIEQGFSGFHITVGDLARVGMMLADGGRVGDSPVAPAGYVAELSQPWSDTSAHGEAMDGWNDWAYGYGYQVWRGREGFRLDGAYGQFSVVLPERRLVIAYQGSTLTTQRTMNAFFRFVEEIDAADGTAEVGADPGPQDAWTARATLTAAPDGALPSAGVRLEDGADGWTLTLPPAITGGAEIAIAVGEREWTTSVVDLTAPDDGGDAVVESPPVADGTHVRLAARGGHGVDGLLVHVAAPTSPHRLLVRRDADGTIETAWHTVPLQGRTLSALAVPEWLAS